MIDYPTFCRLRQLHDAEGLKTSPIAAALHLDPKTVEKWIEQPTYQPRQGTPRPSKLDTFKGQITGLLQRHPYTAQPLCSNCAPRAMPAVTASSRSACVRCAPRANPPT